MLHFAVKEFSVNEIHEKFDEYMEDQENVELASNFIYESLIEDLTMGVLFEFHHGIKTGLTEIIDGDPEKEDPHQIVTAPECDVFGLSVVKKTPDCNCCCPNCDRPVSATRFAPHLEKCMGMGRNSSRIASRRIASNSKEPALYAGLSDDDDDADWVGDKRKKKLRNNGVKKQTKVNGNAKVSSTNGTDSASSSQEPGGATYETMSWNEKKNLLLQICGVVSEHTKKLCTRSTRCPQHTEEQRKTLRSTVLDPSLEHGAAESQSLPPPLTPLTPTPLTPHDVGSPPDSSPSSTCSSSSRKRDKHRSKTTKNPKREKLNHSPGRE